MVANTTNYTAIPPTEDGHVSPLKSPTRPRLHRILGAIVIVLAGSAIIGTIIVLGTKSQKEPKRNVIMMVSDGFGPASETFARQFHCWREDLPVKSMLPLDEVHVGHSRTQSSSSLVTDSAAGATAFSCGLKSYNGAIGVDPEETPCGTVLESAKLHRNMLTGLVVTSRVTHATPGAFSAHVAWRDWENQIAEQQIGHNPLGRTVDLMFGGGLCEFLSNTTQGSCRADQRDLLDEARTKFGWSISRTRAEFDTIADDAQLPLMGLFAPNHMAYEIDRVPSEEPSLKEMTQKALAILKKASEKADTGFFLMIEGSRIDMAAHTNDPAAHIHDIWEYQQVFKIVREFVEANPNTVVISTSDHETGGFTAGRQVGEDYPEYKWNPEVIHRVQNSSEQLAQVWADAVQSNIASQDMLRNTIIHAGLGIDDPTDEEMQKLNEWNHHGKSVLDLAYLFADMVSRRALIGWTTHGHTAVDVNLYAVGPGTEKLRGSHENTEIGDFIVEYLDLDLDDITRRLNDGSFYQAAVRPDMRGQDVRREAAHHYHG
ncbi:alkaline-phosphatase-like protein [Radiomyces spectabilis]|uniref:alkaline-phosphatase-like protein n=1 Tax=Radiomyces spectabilis TaxID=64574 RepID=UPI00221EB704|nr:alkaline-phosphatase-like protein [Radiomyces spectabilis]KAI8372697.1 alkaline-phosphatase-like protein [Radiomyces spectabilis]